MGRCSNFEIKSTSLCSPDCINVSCSEFVWLPEDICFSSMQLKAILVGNLARITASLTKTMPVALVLPTGALKWLWFTTLPKPSPYKWWGKDKALLASLPCSQESSMTSGQIWQRCKIPEWLKMHWIKHFLETDTGCEHPFSKLGGCIWSQENMYSNKESDHIIKVKIKLQ